MVLGKWWDFLGDWYDRIDLEYLFQNEIAKYNLSLSLPLLSQTEFTP